MDSAPLNMYDTFKEQLGEELGPLDPDWFDTLTAQAFTKEENVSEQDELSVHQEGNFKTPLDKSALESQFFSTPKVFRQSKAVSPERELSFTREQEKETLPWKATSPYLFGTSKDGLPEEKSYGGIQPQDSFELLNTPLKTPTSFAKHISESLGAQIHPDISWTSSLNTPPAHHSVPSTLILSKPEESPHPVNLYADKNVIFVRKLFPSLSNVSGAAVSSQYEDVPTVQQGVGSPEPGQRRNSHNSPESTQSQSDSVWRQTLPDAIDDEEIRSTVASVLDGAETVLSMFFSNSSSALRRVKTDSRKRKQSNSTAEYNCDSTEKSPTRNVATSDQRTNDQEPGRASSSQQFRSPTKTGDVEITQWSPLSLSDISHCTMDASCRESDATKQQEINISKEKLTSDMDSGQQLRPSFINAVSKKKRMFVYSVQSSKPQVQGEDVHSQKIDSTSKIPLSGQEINVNQLRNTTGEEQYYGSSKKTFDQGIPKLGTVSEENLPPSVQAKSQDLDMSQLCRAFAQDLTQVPDLSKPSKLAEDAPQNGFSTSACLSALKRSKLKSSQQWASLDHDYNGISSRTHVSSTNQNNYVVEGTASDSGFQSAMAGTTEMPVSSFVLPSTEKVGQSQQRSDFKSGIHRPTTFQSPSKGNGKEHFDDIMQENETNIKLEESQTLGPAESELDTGSTSTRQWSDTKAVDNNINCIPLRVGVDVTVPQQTVVSLPSVHTAGFKTASNKGIKISSVNLERAKRLFEESEGQSPSGDQSTERCHATKDQNGMACGSTKTTISNSNHLFPSNEKFQDHHCLLTPSQKAEVTELCSLLEQADSQFEFTQFKAAKAVQPCQGKAASQTDKDLDPDFLSGIDFDDSFNSTPGIMSSVFHSRTNCEKPPIKRTSTGNSSGIEFNKEKASSGDVASVSSNILPSKPINCDIAGCSKTSKNEHNNPVMSAGGFKTAGGNVLRVSKTCLSKARALFADLEDNFVKNPHIDDGRNDIPNCEQPQKSPEQQNIETEGKTEDQDSMGNNTGNFLLRKDDASEFRSNDNCHTGDGIKICSSDVRESLCSDRRVPAIQSNELCTSGFQLASGKGIAIPEKAMQEANTFFSECDDMDGNVGASVKHQECTAPESRSVGKKNHSECKKAQGVKGNICEEPVSGCSEFKNVNVGSVANRVKVLHQENVEIHSGRYKNTTTSNTASLHGNPSSTAKPLSLPSCTTSNIIGDGFSTASGKTVHVSLDAMAKAKFVLNETDAFEGQIEQQNQKDHSRTGPLTRLIKGSPTQNGGFQTASGKGINVSSAALNEAKALLSECDGAENKKEMKPTTKALVDYPQTRNNEFFGSSVMEDLSSGGGFCTVGGKKVCVSADAITKANVLLNKSDAFEDRSKEQGQKHAGHLTGPIKASPLQNGGFQTASGKGVAVSSAALKKVKALLSEYDGAENKKEMKTTTKALVDYPQTRNNEYFGSSVMEELSSGGGFCTVGGKKVCVSADAMTKANVLLNKSDAFEDRSKQQGQKDAGHLTGLIKASPLQNGGFQTASGKGVAVSSAALKKAKALLSECDGVEDENPIKPTTNLPTDDPLSRSGVMDGLSGSGGGFCPANGKKVCFSADAMTKEKHLLNESNAFEDQNRQRGRTGPIQALPPQNGGFQTASGKTVAISAVALTKAKALLSESDGIEDENRIKPTTSVPVNAEPTRSYGFSAASGKPVAFSAEALQKAKSLFSTEIPSVSAAREGETRCIAKHDDMKNNAKKKDCAFTTAGGAKVHVSEKSLLKAKNLLKEISDEECPNPNIITKSSTRSVNAPHTDLSKVDLLKRTNFESEKEADGEINRTSNSEVPVFAATEASSVLNFQPLNLGNCTDTQQRFVAQEALDCAKALLEDEVRAGQTLSMTSENVPLQEDPECNKASVEEQKGTGKRSIEDTDMTGQPLPKRRLLEEFNRSVDGARRSTLHPQKSCRDGVMNDRRVFKYSVSLHANITRPHSDGKNYVVTGLQKTTPQLLTPNSTVGEGRSSHSGITGFAPPFLKNVTTESHKSNESKDNTRKSPAFVPPFKKQRHTVQESSLEPQKDQDQNRHLSKRNTYVPPFKKTQNITEITGNKSKEAIQTSVDAADEDLMKGQNLDFGYGAKDSPAEASGVENKLSTSQDIVQNLQSVELARDMQDMRIRKKKRQTIRPLPGSLFLTKTSGVSRIPLKAAANGQPPARYTQQQLYGYGLHQHVSEVTSESSESFRFSLRQFFKQEAFTDDGGVKLADGGWLVPRNDGTAGKEEFYRALCDTPGVDPKLISEEWVYNHYRWIVWKQASMERSFPATMGSLCLTPEQVLLQLKYRYDVEVDHSRRPALRRIMEKDDTPAKTLVLCVCGVVSRGDIRNAHGADSKIEEEEKKNPVAVIWLTDGWYSIKAQIDGPLTAMLHKGRLAIGGKLIIHGAELVGSQEACSPLEAPESIMLKICANSSRPARWDAKLGFHRDPRPFLLPVSCLYGNGGPVGCVDIVVLRSYPIQWMERKTDGGIMFRSTRAEEKQARRYDSHKQKAMENIFAKVQAEVEKEERGNDKLQRKRRTLSRQDIASLQDGEELHEAVGDDPAYLEAHLSEQQLETLGTYRQSLMEKRQAELQDRYRCALEHAEDDGGSCPKRDVTPVWRLCIADFMNQSGNGVYQMNIWRPSPDLQSLLKEGCRYKVYNIATSDGRKRCGSAAVQFTATKKTQFQDLQASQEWLSARFQPRASANFVDLQNPEFQPLCGEVDLTGCVVSVTDGQGPSPALYLVDGDLNFVKVRCFSSLAQSGLEDVVKPPVLLALSNLQLRAQSSAPIPILYAGDLTLFSTNPKELHLRESFSQLRNMVQGQENFFANAEERLSHFVRPDGPSSFRSPALQPQTPGSRSDRKQDTKTCVTSQHPIRSCGSSTPVSRDQPPTNSSAEKDPKSLKRRRALDCLSRIPSPPPLSQLDALASPCVNKTFNPPRRSGTPGTLKTVRTPAPKSASPVEDEWVNDEELAMIDTQALLYGDLGQLTV